ncbi:hypothetical protein BVC71_02755 [Marivivens niveibacter]|uniref:DUF927 domain-containing protein n=1 Tax=Marivivens niveibacter TaxID=1930667 RepID=A0A251X129_9RHOB|nr:hypothetical protein [Marivivens niveibacter]OUD10439.1 hypothetical protein BVC71_02755 [Marivivens niveibacter]
MGAMIDDFLNVASVMVEEASKAEAKKREDEAAQAATDDAATQRKIWLAERRDEIMRKHGLTAAVADQILLRAADQLELSGEFELHVVDPKTFEPEVVTVRDVLENPDTYHNRTTLDPLEPEYCDYKSVGVLFLKGRAPKLVSQAHGGATYALVRGMSENTIERIRIEFTPDNPAGFVDRCVEALRATGLYYTSGSTTVCRNGQQFKPVRTERLDYDLSRIVAPFKYEMTKKGPARKSIDIPRRLLLQVETLCDGKLPKLAGTSDHPLCRLDGTLIADAGYDDKTGVFIFNGTDAVPEISRSFDAPAMKAAVETCLTPFRAYHFPDKVLGRTALLAAVMTAVLRPALDTAPMIAVSSPEVGVGKSFIAQALGVLATGELPRMKSVERSGSAEMRKLLHADLLEQNPVIIYDNMDGNFRNEVLTSFIASPIWSDRILGESRTGGSIRNTALLISNGVNMTFPRGMNRRYLLIDLLPACDDHITADFGFTPQSEAKRMRADIISAALSIAVAARPDKALSGTLGSFEGWTRMVRDPILRLSREIPELGLCDPLDLFKQAISDASEVETYHSFLFSLAEKFGPEDFTADQVRTAIFADEMLERLCREISDSDPSLSVRSVAALMSKLKGVNYNGAKLTARKRAGTNLWRIEVEAPKAIMKIV